MTSVTILSTGLSEHELIYINADKTAKTIAMKMFLPDSTAKGKYVIAGKVAVLELEFPMLWLGWWPWLLLCRQWE